APTRRLQHETLVAGAAAALLAAALGWLLAGRITRSCNEICAAAARLAQGEPVSLPRLPVHEGQQIADALAGASMLLRARDVQRQHTEAALRESEERFRGMAEAVPSKLFENDADGRRIWTSSRSLRHSGMTEAETAGDGWAQAMHPDDLTVARTMRQESVRTGREYAYRARVLGRGRAWRWHLIHVMPVRGAGGAIERWLGSDTDVHDLIETEAALRDLTENLGTRVREEVAAREAAQVQLAHAERMQALGQLAGGIAHDFNNVLQAVQGAAALIERRPADAQRVRRFARTILDAGTRGIAVTGRLLAFARRGDLQAEAVEPARLLEGLSDILALTLGSAIAVRVDLAASLPPLLADQGQLETVLVNLATNARDAKPDGGTLTLAAAADQVSERAGHPRS
ncbi:MAG: PAS domain S-box protein, partial [Pseudomonadota bacterium]|nr:PAS domain S-box protein [Pseudomonadota bacterium]